MVGIFVYVLFMVCSVGVNSFKYATYSVYNSAVISPNETTIISCIFPGHHNSAVVYYKDEALTPTFIGQNGVDAPKHTYRTEVILKRCISYETAGAYECVINRSALIVYRAVVGPLICEHIYDGTVCNLTASYDPEHIYDLDWYHGGATSSKITNGTIKYSTLFPRHYSYIDVYITYRGFRAYRRTHARPLPRITTTILSSSAAAFKQTLFLQMIILSIFCAT